MMICLVLTFALARLSVKIRNPAVAAMADCTVYDTLINDHLDNKNLPCSQEHNQNGHMRKKASYNK